MTNDAKYHSILWRYNLGWCIIVKWSDTIDIFNWFLFKYLYRNPTRRYDKYNAYQEFTENAVVWEIFKNLQI